MLGTGDAGRSWKSVNLGGTLLALTAAGPRAWALVSGCRALNRAGCAVRLWEDTATAWREVAFYFLVPSLIFQLFEPVENLLALLVRKMADLILDGFYEIRSSVRC